MFFDLSQNVFTLSTKRIHQFMKNLSKSHWSANCWLPGVLTLPTSVSSPICVLPCHPMWRWDSTSLRLLLYHVSYNCDLFPKWHLPILFPISSGSPFILSHLRISPWSSRTAPPIIKRYDKNPAYSLWELWCFALSSLFALVWSPCRGILSGLTPAGHVYSLAKIA